MESARPRFPLPKGFFGDVALDAKHEAHFRHIVHTQVQSALAEEAHFVHAQQRVIDESKWKLAKQEQQLRIYRRRKATKGVVTDLKYQPSMLGTGYMSTGTIEDVIYGAYDRTHEEMKITSSFVDVKTADCTVLHTIETATPDDPFHYLGLKWMLTKFPGALVVKQRDWCYLEGMGIETDEHGHRYGYLVTHSVKLFNCPPFHRKVALRGQLYFTYIFRETDYGHVTVYARGMFDPVGELTRNFAVRATAEVMCGIIKAVQCAQAKKLTLLALMNTGFSYDRVGSKCSLCTRSPGSFSPLKACRVCGHTICKSCYSKKRIFVGSHRSVCKVVCCPDCILKASAMNVRPAEEAFSILTEYFLPEHAVSLAASEQSSPSMAMQRKDTLQSRLQRISSSSSGLSEETIDAMLARSEFGKPANPDDAVAVVLDVELGSSDGDSAPIAPKPVEPKPFQYELKEVTSRAIISRPIQLYDQSSMAVSPQYEAAQRRRASLYEQLVVLEKAVRQVHDITQANEEFMDHAL